MPGLNPGVLKPIFHAFSVQVDGQNRVEEMGFCELLTVDRRPVHRTATLLGAFTCESQPWRSGFVPLVRAKNSS